MNLIQYLIQHSAACTFMNKLRLNSRKEVFRRYGATLRVQVSESGKEGTVELQRANTLPRLGRFSKNPPIPLETVYWSLRSRALLDAACAACGSRERVEMHHIRRLRAGTTKGSFKDTLANQTRKQVPLCRPCHLAVHRGEYSGRALRELTATQR